ncbi:MAG: hypothetical protein H7066_16650 [Cytophagaceae bacterium]|nr:hypothetical protein [Gemmatimonadaceae bacterium]
MRFAAFSLFVWSLVPAPTAAQETAARTTVVVLGVNHSLQLVAEGYQPAWFRAFYDRVKPAAFAIERSPEQFARNDHYEFTYEIQFLTLPYARAHGIPTHPVDWYPSLDDQLLGFGVDVDAPPILRPKNGFQGFLTFPDSSSLRETLFYADAPAYAAEQRQWYDVVPEQAARDLPRRLFLYRTFMQARRIRQAAALYRGRTLLVVIGSMHKDDIERILRDDPGISIVQPSSFGLPPTDAVQRAVADDDRFAIASFNLLGVQAGTGVVDWAWMRRVVDALPSKSSEAGVLRTRLAVLTGAMPPERAAPAYAAIAREAGNATFRWTGVKDRRRLDSFFDPFGNLALAQRASLEEARERYKLGDVGGGDAIRTRLRSALAPAMQAQLDGYWTAFVVGKK